MDTWLWEKNPDYKENEKKTITKSTGDRGRKPRPLLSYRQRSRL